MSTNYKEKYEQAQAQSDRNFARYQHRKEQSDRNFSRYEREKNRADESELEIKKYQEHINYLNTELAKARASSGQSQTTSKMGDSREPLHILGLQPGYSQDKLREVYKRLINRYHPDQHIHMSPEFIREAEAEFNKVKEVYLQLKK